MVRILGAKTGQKKGNMALIGAGIFLSLVIGMVVGRMAPIGWPDTPSLPVIAGTELQQWQPITQAQNEAMAERDRILTEGTDYGLAQVSQQWQPITQAQNEMMAERDRILTGGTDYGLAQVSQQWQPIAQPQNEAMAERDRILTGN